MKQPCHVPTCCLRSFTFQVPGEAFPWSCLCCQGSAATLRSLSSPGSIPTLLSPWSRAPGGDFLRIPSPSYIKAPMALPGQSGSDTQSSSAPDHRRGAHRELPHCSPHPDPSSPRQPARKQRCPRPCIFNAAAQWSTHLIAGGIKASPGAGVSEVFVHLLGPDLVSAVNESHPSSFCRI